MHDLKKRLPSTLTLLRHAKSSWSDIGAPDHDRTLNERGKRDAPEMARRLAERKMTFDLILCSTAKRTRETADLMLPILRMNSEKLLFESRIYEASVNDLLDVVTAGHTGSVLVIGHNPGLEELCDTLSPGSVSHMPTCAVASFDITPHHNDEVSSITTGVELAFYDYPKNG